ncbi:ApaG protein [Caballeronia sordidicola]|uniref:ApaG protein n=1 Tax=Caballeronia sordidicola TaxID=196367 RepID=A0A242MRT1_CABSO|nr:ApaG protein [Caballeronia sordidicola]OTP74877.1 ApaG protein [Caballeronia sordidicola]
MPLFALPGVAARSIF